MKRVHVGELALVGSPPVTVLVRVTIHVNQGPVRTFNCNVTNEEKTPVAANIDSRALH